MGRVLSCGLLIAVFALSLVASQRMTMSVSPQVSFAPGRVVVRATIEKDEQNRAVEFVAESTDFYRSSTRHLDGDRAAKTTVVEFRSLPRGDYRVSARLLGPGDEIRAIVQRAVIVASPRRTIVR